MVLSVNIQRSFPGMQLDVSFDAPAGVTALFGPSGCGKTSTINAVAGLMQPDHGRITLNGQTLFDSDALINLPPQARRIGYVFQDARLFPHMTVSANLRYPARFNPKADRDFDHVVDLLALGPLLQRKPRNLSGGEQQRTAIGRALLSDPALLVMDEPLAALDQRRKSEIMPWLERLRDEVRLPILYVTHASAEILRLATTLVLMQQGRVIHAGPLADALVDPVIGPAIGPREVGALIPARILSTEPDGMQQVRTSAGLMLLPATGQRIGAEIRLRIFAHEVILAREAPEGLSALNVLPGRVSRIEGGYVQITAGDSTLLAQITQRSVQALGLQPGTPCHAIIKSAAIVQS